MSRKYHEHLPLENAASEIASDVIFTGRSTGWGGSLEDCESLQKMLKPFNIVYYDDMIGGWRLGKSNSKD